MKKKTLRGGPWDENYILNLLVGSAGYADTYDIVIANGYEYTEHHKIHTDEAWQAFNGKTEAKKRIRRNWYNG